MNVATTSPPRAEGLQDPRAAAPQSPLVAVRGTPLRVQRIVLGVGLVLAAWIALQLFASILLPFVVATGIAYFLDPVARRLNRAGIPRAAASLLLIIALIAGGLLFTLLLYPLILQQLGLLIARVPAYAGALRDWAGQVLAKLAEHLPPNYIDDKLRDLVAGEAGNMLSIVVGAVSRLVGGGFALFSVVSLVLVTPVVSFYLLRDWPAIMQRIDAWLPRRYAPVLRQQAHEVDRILAAWLRGQALCCVLLALYYAVGLSVAGLDLGLIVGLMAGMLSFIPYVGSITGLIASVGLALAQFPTWEGVAVVAAVFVLGQILEGYVIYPRFLGDRVELHAVWVIFALFAGGAAFGFLGVLIAVPVTAVIGVVTRFWLRRYLQSPLYLEEAEPPGEGRVAAEPG